MQVIALTTNKHNSYDIIRRGEWNERKINTDIDSYSKQNWTRIRVLASVLSIVMKRATNFTNVTQRSLSFISHLFFTFNVYDIYESSKIFGIQKNIFPSSNEFSFPFLLHIPYDNIVAHELFHVLSRISVRGEDRRIEEYTSLGRVRP